MRDPNHDGQVTTSFFDDTADVECSCGWEVAGIESYDEALERLRQHRQTARIRAATEAGEPEQSGEREGWPAAPD